MTGIQITGLGTVLPEKIVTNDDFSKLLDTTDTWIAERTGIKERRMGGTTWELGRDAGKKALEDAGVSGEDISTLILATSSPYRVIPATSAAVSRELNISGGAFDLNAACAGFVYGLVLADGLIRTGEKKILLIGSENITQFVDMEDRSTAVLFGDGAGAVVIEPANEGEGCLLSYGLATEGSLEHILFCEHGEYLKMEGKEVFRKAVQVMIDLSNEAMEKAGLGPDDIDLLIPHQANSRIISAANSRLNIPPEKTIEILAWTGNTSTASIPLALDFALEKGRLKNGDTILLVGFGAGMTAASAILRWNK